MKRSLLLVSLLGLAPTSRPLGELKLRSDAFTLIELLIVVAIIAILAAIAVPNFVAAQVRSKVSRTMADLRTQAVAVEAYHVDNNYYPLHGHLSADDVVEEPALSAAYTDINEFLTPAITTPIAYLANIPSDIFAANFVGPMPWIQYYDYINLAYHITLPGAPPLAIAQSYVVSWGDWRMSGVGPDNQDRNMDIKNNIIYDPSNGTVSIGAIVRCQVNPNSVPAPGQ